MAGDEQGETGTQHVCPECGSTRNCRFWKVADVGGPGLQKERAWRKCGEPTCLNKWREPNGPTRRRSGGFAYE